LDIVGHVVSKEGRRVSRQKKNKIITWPTPENVTELRGFLGLVTYVRIFIENLSEKAAPLRQLTRKEAEWKWSEDCEEAFKRLKQIIGEDIVLKSIDYSTEAGIIRLAVDSSFIAAGAVLSQQELDTGLDRPVLYESIVFLPVESRYSQPKLELCGVARIMKKLQTYLWGQHFELQVDAKSLIQMINSPSLPNAPMTRWVAFIQLFSFDIVHKPGKTFTLPDALSRRPISSEEEEFYEDQPDFDEEEPLIKPCYQYRICSLETDKEENKWEAPGYWQHLRHYLETLEKPPEMDQEDFAKLRRNSARFFSSEGRLMRKHSPAPQIVISKEAYQDKLLRKVHEDLGHRGIEETYQRLVTRFWWPSLKKKVRLWIHSCEACQKRDPLVPREIRNPTGTSSLFGRVALDACHIKAGQYKYLIVARDDLSGWVEAAPLVKLTSSNVAKFLLEYWVYRYGSIKTVTTDNGAEFEKEFVKAVQKIGAKLILTSPYYPEANGMVERGHKTIKDTLVKMCGQSGGKWREYLPLVLFSDRISTKRTTGYTPYEIIFGQLPVLPVDLEMDTYLGVDWLSISTTEELLEARTKQLARKDEIIKEAHRKLLKTREASVDIGTEKWRPDYVNHWTQVI
jgi:transposase InsO family protein